MFDLQTAPALVDLALECRVGLALVGDPYQALPVGHAGATASAMRSAAAPVELDTAHRFSGPECAALTLRMRNPSDRDGALTIAGELFRRGQVQHVRCAATSRLKRARRRLPSPSAFGCPGGTPRTSERPAAGRRRGQISPARGRRVIGRP
ncbi:hypothetical protein FHX48_000743 [Microbacterium halimionae]|uniref:UvrD-like helicase C-terminal domain-containing protein n=1 Tax=Microbacterium halimionae TaxID=1526413 RepID=A0A7W3JMP4_9MICO|nr:hypothetical protein [Microbacterium halimionae]NII95737.1 hypothetical protein [Microbacterium halimionae]